MANIRKKIVPKKKLQKSMVRKKKPRSQRDNSNVPFNSDMDMGETVRVAPSLSATVNDDDLRGSVLVVDNKLPTHRLIKIQPKPKKLKKQPAKFEKRPELWIFCLRCIQAGISKFEMKFLLLEFIESLGYKPVIGPKKFDEIVAQARAELRIETAISRDDHVANGHDMLKRILADETTSVLEKIKAQALINDMLGLSARYSVNGESAQEKLNLIAKLLNTEDPGYAEGPPDLEHPENVNAD